MSLKKKQANSLLSLIIHCPDDKTFLLLFDETRGDYWIPFTDMNDNLSWKDNLENFRNTLIECDVNEEKLLKIYKIWTFKKEILHLMFLINVSEQIKKNFKTETPIGIAGWHSCSAITKLKPLFRSLEVLEVINMYKPDIKSETKVTGEPLPLGCLTEIRKHDILVNDENCGNVHYLDLLNSAKLETTEQCDLYEDYFHYTCPCIYMNCISFGCAMEKYDLFEDVSKLFYAADVWKRNFLTFQDFLYLFAVMSPLSAHYGHLEEIRCQYIFRYYNENHNGKLNFSDFKNLICDIEKKKNPDVTEKELEKLFENLAKSLNFKPKTTLTFDQFYANVFDGKITDTTLLLRLKDEFCKTSLSDTDEPGQKLHPSEFIIPLKPCKICYPNQPPSYSIALNTTLLKQDDESPFLLRDLKLLEDTMTKSVSEEFQILTNPDYLKSELLNLEEKVDDLLSSLKYFTNEIQATHLNAGECDVEDKPAYSWGSYSLDKLAVTFVIICEAVKEIICAEPRLLEIQPPAYVMGDLHGNFHDLMCFEKTLWRHGVTLSPAKMLFLGDYVDRGSNGVEILMYLFAYKIQNPEKWFLLRGNHEIRDIQKLFTFQRECNNTFGETIGGLVWKAVNEVFDVMPLAAIIDHKVFCCHGGIPPPWLCPTVSAINSIPNPLVNCERQSPLAWTLMWNDPLRVRFSRNSLQQMELITNEGFVPNFQRGTGFCFNCFALEKFLSTNNLSHVIRAHEVVKAGFQIHQKGKLLTVFSSSNYCGGKNYAGTVLVADSLLRVCMIDTGKKR